MHATPKSFCSIQLMMKSSFFSLSTALTYYIHLSNPMGNHRHYKILETQWKANAGFDQECDDKEFALGFFQVLESQFAFSSF